MPASTKPDIRQLVKAFSEEFPVTIVPRSEEVPREQLFVALPADHAGRARQLELVFLPDEDDVHFLQYFVPLEFAISPAHVGDLARVILRINASSPLIGFGMLEDLALVCFRSVVPCPKQALDPEIHVQTLYLILYILDQLGAIVEGVANGTLSHADALVKLAAAAA